MADQLAQATRRVRVAPSVEELLADVTWREAWKNSDSLSGSRLERVAIAGEPFVVKYTCVDEDWIMRATGDLHCRQLNLFGSGVLDSLPQVIDHAIVACAPYVSARGHRGGAFLMRDVSADLVPVGSESISLDLHRRFLDHMAQMHAAYIDFAGGADLFPLAHQYVILTPTMAALEAARDGMDPVPPAVGAGWRAMQMQHPRAARALLDLAGDPSPLLSALSVGPQTLIHSDWKLGNLGSTPTTTVLLDWDRCGAGPPTVDLAWYLAVNCDRLPETKEQTIAAYRSALESAGVDTASWWDAQLRAALVGGFLQLGWSKNDDSAEFEWWSDRLDEALLYW
jgi:Phosphotransferase enzyme family